MEYGLLQDHSDAVMDLLYASSLTVFPSEDGGAVIVPNGTPPPFVTAHTVVGRLNGNRLPTRSTRLLVRIHVHCTGVDDVQARGVSDLVAAALLDVRPVIAGRTCFPIRHESQQPPREDESTGALLATLTEVYRLETLPGVDGS